jgi:DNA polymerase-3 subunit delta'
MPWDILGHEWAVNLLQEQLRRERIRHAYLFTGPEGVGRRTLALRFAQALNCTEPPEPGEPCGICRDCRQLRAQQHPDLAIVQGEEPGKAIKVDQIRELQHGLHLAPYQARYRIALLRQFERANASAANALLKLLEEPPPQVVLLLTAENPERLLPTIVSRCEILRLRPQPAEVLRTGLETHWGIDPDRAKLLAHISDGRPGYAHQLAEHPELLEQRQTWLKDLLGLLQADTAARFSYAKAASKDRGLLTQTLHTWLSFWRDVLLRTAGSSSAASNPDHQREIENMAAQLDISSAHRAVAALNRTLGLIEGNINLRLATEVLMLELPRVDLAT